MYLKKMRAFNKFVYFQAKVSSTFLNNGLYIFKFNLQLYFYKKSYIFSKNSFILKYFQILLHKFECFCKIFRCKKMPFPVSAIKNKFILNAIFAKESMLKFLFRIFHTDVKILHILLKNILRKNLKKVFENVKNKI